MNYFMLLIGAYLALTNSRNSDVRYNQADWDEFKSGFGKSYDGKEVESLRRSIFATNKHQIDQFNAEQSEEAGFSLGLNHLADVSELEMKSINGFRVTDKAQLESSRLNSPQAEEFLQRILDDNSIEVPDAVDWRNVSGRVSRVKNQGACGSCWAFATTGVLEGQEKVRSGKKDFGDADLVELSEQNLVDCTTKDYGCNGGLMEDALNQIKEEGGIDDEQSYPYKGVTRKCRFDKSKVAITDAGAAILPAGDEQKLKEVVAKFGPVAVAIDASSLWFQFYRHGVYYNRHCKNKLEQLDHAVLVVGYGTDPKKGDYWIVKNSWGSTYGEHGYIRMSRNRGNNCGIATVATIPTF